MTDALSDWWKRWKDMREKKIENKLDVCLYLLQFYPKCACCVRVFLHLLLSFSR